MKPKFTISRLGAQERVATVDTIILPEHFERICLELTGHTRYHVEWVESRIEGKMFTFETDETLYYITYTPNSVDGRNSYLQSVPTAFALYLERKNAVRKPTEFCLYLTPCRGLNQTRYHQLMYRLLASINVRFLNTSEALPGLEINEYHTVRELISDRDDNRERNSGNQSSFITDEGTCYNVYGKTFGANQKETATLCYALCRITDKPIRVFQITDNSSQYLSKADIKGINSYAEEYCEYTMEILDDTYEFTEGEEEYRRESPEESLRSPRFICNLLEKTGGHKCCSLCHCKIESIIQGAHIYPVHAIKRRTDLSFDEKIRMATDGDNGLWLCENHHKLFDRGLIKFVGRRMITMPRLSDHDKLFVNNISPFPDIDYEYYTEKMNKYFSLRDIFYRSERIY